MGAKTDLIRIVQCQLVKSCDQLSEKFDEKSGKFLEKDGGWAVTNQDGIYTLAYCYLHEFDGNPYFQSAECLEMVKKGGDAIRAAQREDGKVLFVKIDGSTWGYTSMGWTMFHWLQTYDIMQNTLDPDTLQSWKEGLLLAYNGIYQSLQSLQIHNIPVWNSAAIWRAGQLFNRNDYQEIAQAMIRKTIKEQHEDGFWPEHEGPTMSYNAVYIYALAAYRFYGGTIDVHNALQRAFSMQKACTYPDGTLVETADGRVMYRGHVFSNDLFGYLRVEGGISYSLFILQKAMEKNVGLDVRFVNVLRELNLLEEHESKLDPPLMQDATTVQGRLQVIRQDGWQVNLSAYTAPITDSRWGMDRQMFVSVWHKDKGLIIGGGNSKYQPKWSTFQVIKGPKTMYVPEKATRQVHENRIDLHYANCVCSVVLTRIDEQSIVLDYAYRSDGDVDHVVVGMPLRFSTDAVENDFSMDHTSQEVHISYKGYTVQSGADNTLLKWPVQPFNPYEKQGRSPKEYWAALLHMDITKTKRCTVKIAKSRIE